MSNITLWQGDSIEMMNLIPDESVDLVLTDPPYGISYQSNWGRKDGLLKKIENDSNLNWFSAFAKESYRLLKNNTAFYCFTRFDVYPKMYSTLTEAGFKIKNLLVVQKGHKGGNGDLQAQYNSDCELIIYANKGRRKFNHTELCVTDGRAGRNKWRRRLSNVWFDTSYNTFPKSTVNVSNQNSHGVVHPTEKTVEISEWIIQISSNAGEVIFDPFMGLGGVGVASKKQNRKFIGIELDEEYFMEAKERIDNA